MDRSVNVLSARAATAFLGVKRETLYAYVSRGLVRSVAGEGRERQELAVLAMGQRAHEAAQDGPVAVRVELTDIGPQRLRPTGEGIPGQTLDQRFGSLLVEPAATQLLHEIEGHAMPEIAEVLSIPLNTAYSRLRLARQDYERAMRRLRAQRGEG